MAQVDELVTFVQREHQPGNIVLVVGDFNVQAHNPRLAEPTGDHQDLSSRMARLGLEDVWAGHGVGPGHTCSFSSAHHLPADSDEPDQVADDPLSDPASADGERIDYLWLGAPSDVEVGVDRPRRWAFAGRGVKGGPAGSLSDHLAVSVTLRVTT